MASHAFMKQPPQPIAGWTVTEQPIVIWMSNQFHRSAIIRVGPDIDRHVYISRIGSNGERSPLAILPGAKIIVIAGPESAMRLAKTVGFPVAFTDDEFEFFRGVI